MPVEPHRAPVSLRSLARLVGRSDGAVRKWIKRRDWPFRDGPFDVGLVRQWMEIHLKRDPARAYHDAQKGIGPRPVSQVDQARAFSYFQAGQFRKLRLEQLQGKLHDAEECSARRRRQILMVRNTLTRSLPRALAADLVGRARGDMERLIRDRMIGACNAFAGMEGSHGAQA